jgi:hypothetical protein
MFLPTICGWGGMCAGEKAEKKTCIAECKALAYSVFSLIGWLPWVSLDINHLTPLGVPVAFLRRLWVGD